MDTNQTGVSKKLSFWKRLAADAKASPEPSPEIYTDYSGGAFHRLQPGEVGIPNLGGYTLPGMVPEPKQTPIQEKIKADADSEAQAEAQVAAQAKAKVAADALVMHTSFGIPPILAGDAGNMAASAFAAQHRALINHHINAAYQRAIANASSSIFPSDLNPGDAHSYSTSPPTTNSPVGIPAPTAKSLLP